MYAKEVVMVLEDARLLAPPAWVIIVLALFVLVLVANDAILGRRDYAKFIRAMKAAAPERASGVRARFLLKWAWQPWVLTIVSVAFIALAPGVALTNAGFTWPDFSAIAAIVAGGGILGGAVVGIAIGVGGMLLFALFSAFFGRKHEARQSALVNPNLQEMLPTARVDRRAWILLSATAAITEEVMYRGVAMLATVLLFPWAPDALVFALVVLYFAGAHLYQGLSGVLVTGALGAVFLALFVATGSLLPGVLLHFIVDVRAVALKTDPATNTSETGS
ncbi:MAG: CPBP family intramembrane glutamic endopeptidase [Microbacterium sp.]|uniref:CPBP family intramembrane glutamic endopeptidase n=1 Tax=Microbacterium sp. TaxID=51671 RepID=UPI003F9A732B